MKINELAINTIKMNGIAAVNKANSGHPGIVLGASTIMHTLFSKHLIFDPLNPNWVNRDRFVLSVGHGSALLYAQLRLLNLISRQDLEAFRQYQSITPGHPEYKHTKGVEVTTGPLGQGIAMGVGMAVAEEALRARFGEINHKTYVLCGDGDLQEGVSMESMSFAGRQKLKNLIIIYDSNDIQLDCEVSKAFNDNMQKRIEAIHFNYIFVKKNTFKEIDKAINQAKASDKPTFIEVKTIIGQGATKEGTSAVHGAPLGDDIATVRQKLNWTYDDFAIPEVVSQFYKKTIFARGAKAFHNFKVSPKLKKFLTNPEAIIIPELEIEKNVATRVSSGQTISYLNKYLPNFIGGSADLSVSTKALGGDGEFNPENRKGRNIMFGVREFAMAAMANGIAVHSNFKPFVSTFFVFVDYLKPALRLSALMGLPVTYVFTHDSIFVGEDGPTHQPIEQTALVRSIPNVSFIRPADEKEVIGAYEIAVNSKTTPTVIALTRQNIISLSETSKAKIKDGIYYLYQTKSDWTLIASGSELANALALGKELNINVISMSNLTGQITYNQAKAISIEAATTYGLGGYAKYNIGINAFGLSAPGSSVYKHFGLDQDSLRIKIKSIMSNH